MLLNDGYAVTWCVNGSWHIVKKNSEGGYHSRRFSDEAAMLRFAKSKRWQVAPINEGGGLAAFFA
jgi:hypothetical protein